MKRQTTSFNVTCLIPGRVVHPERKRSLSSGAFLGSSTSSALVLDSDGSSTQSKKHFYPKKIK